MITLKATSGYILGNSDPKINKFATQFIDFNQFDQFVQFVTLFQLNMHENSILDDHCFIYSTFYLKKNALKLHGCHRLLLNMLE